MRKRILLTPALILSIIFPSLIFAQNFQTSPDTLSGLIDDLTMLEQSTNIKRLEAIKSLLSQRHIPFEVETFSQESRKNNPRSQGSNVIMTIGSGDSDIVLGAHWDAVWVGENVLSGGIIDNGCSVIILMRIVEKLQKMELNHRIKVVFFDMEEIGLLGAADYAQRHKDDNIHYMINLDVCGAGNTIFFGNREPGGNNQIFTTLKKVCLEKDINFVEFPKFYACDEKPFLALGISSIMISLAPEADVHYLWLLINGPEGGGFKEGYSPSGYLKSMHSSNDTVTMADPAGMTICYQAVLDLVINLDQN